MINEIVNFVNHLDPVLKTLGLRAKEGLHIQLQLQVENSQIILNEQSIRHSAHTGNRDLSAAELAFLKQCAVLDSISWCVNTNKCFDLPIKAIHSCSPYCLAVKRENLSGGEKYLSNVGAKKSQVYERIGNYFGKAAELLETEEEKQIVKVFEHALNSEEKFNAWLKLCPEYDQVKDAQYVIFYLDVPIEKYQSASARYLTDKLFNTNEHNKKVEGVEFGTSDFFNSYPSKKPFLTHQSASFDIAGRISAGDARSLFEFQEIMGRNILPKPLPIFIHQDEIQQKRGRSLLESSIAIFKREAENGSRIGYKEIIEELHDKHEDELGNYYLLFYDRGQIKDFDFVPKFEFLLQDKSGKKWSIEDYFDAGNQQVIKSVFHFQQAVLLPIFNNSLVVKAKTGDFQYRYFSDIESKYCKSEATYLHVIQYRKAFYDFVYKSKRQAVTQTMFNNIIQTSILEDIRLDEVKSGYHTEMRNIRQKLNIWFSLNEYFIPSSNTNQETMANKLTSHREFIQKLSKGETDIESDDQYAFAAGQVIFYLLRKSKTEDGSYKRLEPFMQQVHAKELNKAIARMFDSYKHENFSSNFKNPFAQVLAYETPTNIRDLIPIVLSGIFSKNSLFSDREYTEDIASTQIEETED